MYRKHEHFNSSIRRSPILSKDHYLESGFPLSALDIELCRGIARNVAINADGAFDTKAACAASRLFIESQFMHISFGLAENTFVAPMGEESLLIKHAQCMMHLRSIAEPLGQLELVETSLWWIDGASFTKASACATALWLTFIFELKSSEHSWLDTEIRAVKGITVAFDTSNKAHPPYTR